MSIRLNKALRELNIGIQTAVEFLEKKNELGEVKADLSFKLNDQQYAALVDAFKQDAAVRSEAEKLFKKPKEKKRVETKKEDQRAESLLESNVRQQYKPLGKIDLDHLGQKPAAPETVAPQPEKAPETKAAAVSPVPAEPVEEAPKAVEAEPQAPPPLRPLPRPRRSPLPPHSLPPLPSPNPSSRPHSPPWLRPKPRRNPRCSSSRARRKFSMLPR